jgi:hypothetical protein
MAIRRKQLQADRNEDRADRSNREGKRARRNEERGEAQREYREAHEDVPDYRERADRGEKSSTGTQDRPFSKLAPSRSAGETAALRDAGATKFRPKDPWTSRPKDEVGTPGQVADKRYGYDYPLDRGKGGIEGPAPDRRIDKTAERDDH